MKHLTGGTVGATHLSWRWWVLEVTLYLITLGVMLMLHLDLFTHTLVFEVPPCNDPRLHHTVRDDTVSLGMVLLVSIIAPIAMMFALEFFRRSTTSSLTRSSILSRLLRSGRPCWFMIIGGLYASLLTEVIKVLSRAPRPHFWPACGGCHPPNGSALHPSYMTLQDCPSYSAVQGDSLSGIIKSFPSGHAAVSVFSAVFIAGYLEARFPASTPSSTMRKWLLLPWVVFALLASFSRLWDGAHHPLDILGGAVCGGVVGAYVVLSITNCFTEVRNFEKRPAGQQETRMLPQQETRMLPQEAQHDYNTP